jgi:hypothetical protein
VAVQQWITNGDSVILMADFNNDVVRGTVVRALKLIGLYDVMEPHYLNRTPTFQRGSATIDTILMTREIRPLRSGYVRSPGDHLCVWLEIKATTMFEPLTLSTTAKARRLQCSDPRTVKRYTKGLWTAFQREKINEEVTKLEEVNSKQPRKQEKLWETLDQKLLKARLSAEKTCRKLKMGRTQWSPEYATLRITQKYWCLVDKQQEGRSVDRKFFRRVAVAAGLPVQTRVDKEIIQNNIDEVTRQLKQYKKRHTHKRETWLEGLAKALAEEAETNSDIDVKRVQYLRILRQREHQRYSARLIRQATNADKNFQAMDHIDFIAADGSRVTTYNKDTIEDKLLEENIRRFNQADGSPFLIEPLVRLVGKYGEEHGVHSILDNQFQLPCREIDRYTSLLVKEMKNPDNYCPKEIDLSLDNFVRGWHKAKEHTASGRSGLHFGHFMAACTHNELSRIEQQMANFPLKSGYSPRRWQQGIEVMLLKQANNFYINKLRAILLFEADFNHNNKRIGRCLMQHAEENQWIALEQYGSRKQVSAIDHCLNKRLSFDIIRQYKHPAAICVNDMKGCYDRIVHSVASICMQRMGMTMGPLRSMFFTLQNLQHFIRSAHGVSTKSFSASEVHPVAIQGIGQGNGAGPQIWAAISTVILNLLRSQHAGAEFVAPISGESLRLAGYAYVDDTDIIAHDKNGQDNAVMELQRSIDLWNGGVAATGGQLEPTKTYWYNMQIKWKDGNWSYGSKSELPVTLTMADAHGRTTLEQVEVSEGRRTLGVRLAPDGNNNAEFEYLKGECDQWADKIRAGMLSQKYTWQAFSSTILAKLAYALPATTFSKARCEAITRRLIFVTLSKSGINPHISRDLVFGSPQRLGLGFPDLYVTQGAQAISRVVSFGAIQSGITSKLLRISYELLCIETGLAQPLEEDFNELGQLASACFLTSLWEFIDFYKIVLKGPRSPVRLLREHDTTIMDKIKGELNNNDRVLFNQCRIYLKVILISDITTADGRFISWYAMRGVEDNTRRSKWKWPRQGKPSRSAWCAWQKGIHLLGTRDRSGRIQLHQRLGKWTSDEANGWLWDTTCDRLLNQTTGQIYLKKTGRPTRQANAHFKPWTGTDEQFQGEQRVSVILQPNGDALMESSFSREVRNTQPKCTTFYEYVKQNQQWDWWSDNLQYEESDLE